MLLVWIGGNVEGLTALPLPQHEPPQENEADQQRGSEQAEPEGQNLVPPFCKCDCRTMRALLAKEVTKLCRRPPCRPMLYWRRARR